MGEVPRTSTRRGIADRRQWGDIGLDERRPCRQPEESRARVVRAEQLLPQETRMTPRERVEVVRRIHRHRGGDDSRPRDGQRLVIPRGWRVQNAVRTIERANAVPQADECVVETEATEVQERDSHVISVRPAVAWMAADSKAARKSPSSIPLPRLRGERRRNVRVHGSDRGTYHGRQSGCSQLASTRRRRMIRSCRASKASARSTRR
jgi:hypothetical protein